ncbi:MAG: sugar phosphate isomerase/epimerase family protein [Hyphomicrobiaceae bacterium]
MAVISDETGPRLDTCLAFAAEEGLDAIEIRQVDGINPLSLKSTQLDSAVRRVKAAGLAVAGIATPLFKWPAPGQSVEDLGDQFGFDRAGRTDAQLFEEAIRVSDAFETRNLRIFSFLTYEGFKVTDLKPDFDALLELAERHDKVLMVENEFVCNIARMDQFPDLLAEFGSDRLQPLPDIANSAWVGETPSKELLASVLSRAWHIHFKDYASESNSFVALGEGDIDIPGYVKSLFENVGDHQLTFSIETHAAADKLENTRKSLNYLRSVLGDR